MYKKGNNWRASAFRWCWWHSWCFTMIYFIFWREWASSRVLLALYHGRIRERRAKGLGCGYRLKPCLRAWWSVDGLVIQKHDISWAAGPAMMIWVSRTDVYVPAGLKKVGGGNKFDCKMEVIQTAKYLFCSVCQFLILILTFHLILWAQLARYDGKVVRFSEEHQKLHHPVWSGCAWRHSGI